jgi:hypothetical protein
VIIRQSYYKSEPKLRRILLWATRNLQDPPQPTPQPPRHTSNSNCHTSNSNCGEFAAIKPTAQKHTPASESAPAFTKSSRARPTRWHASPNTPFYLRLRKKIHNIPQPFAKTAFFPA